MKQKDDELKEILQEFSRTHSQKKKEKLRERGNAVSAALLAFEVMYRSLISILKSLQERAKRALEPPHISYTWRVSAYPRSNSSASQSRTELLPLSSRTEQMADEFQQQLRRQTSSYDSACNLYYSYFYGNLGSRGFLVDSDALHQRWPPLPEDTISQVAVTNSQGLILQTSSSGAPAIWLMAIIISALSAWPFPVDEELKDQVIHEILVEVFQATELSGAGHSPNFHAGSRAETLRTDINFWKVHARTRGLDLQITRRFYKSELLSHLGFSLATLSTVLPDHSAHKHE
ncbi:hypothetical protein BDZ45DRAFT_225038 [Acephala macrosclerotiorum]|nr:hypothetical protein BDZ45DRAFT_225038 [Acephala macrosclerotiorum]